MGKAALFLVLSGLLAWTMTSMGDAETYLEREDEQANYEEQVLAREIATSWLNVETSELKSDFANYRRSAADQPFEGGFYDVDVRSMSTPDSVRISVNGFHGDAGYRYEAVYWQVPETQKVPAFFAHGLNVDQNVELNAETRILAGVQKNAGIHTNMNLKNNSNRSYIEGFGHYVKNIENVGQDAKVFQPQTNPDGAPVTERVAPIDIPSLNVNMLKSKATRVTNGNLELSGTVKLGTADNPVIHYVDSGKLFTSGDVTFNGYGVFIVEHNVEFNNNASFAKTGSSSSVLFMTDQNFDISEGVSTLVGNMMGNLNFKNNAKDLTLYGTITTRENNFTINDPITIHFLPPLHTLTDPFWAGTDTVVRPDAGEIVPISVTSSVIEGRTARVEQVQYDQYSDDSTIY